MASLDDPVPPPEPRSKFQTARASEAVLWGLRNNGAPERQYWDARRLEQGQNNLFRLSTRSLPALAEKRNRQEGGEGGDVTRYSLDGRLGKVDAEGRDTVRRGSGQSPVQSPVSSPGQAPGGLLDESPGSSPEPRRQKYYDLLMKHHNKRIDKASKDAEMEEKQRRLDAAQLAQRKRLETEARKLRGELDSESDSEEEAEAVGGDFGSLTAFEGCMKVELEIVVNRAPKQNKLRKKKVKEKKQREKRYREFLLPNGELGYETDSNYTPSSSSSSSYYSSDWSSSGGSSWASWQQSRRRAKRTFSASSVALSSTKSSDSTPRMDIEAELQALQEEMGSSSSSEESDGLDGFREKDNPWNNPNMRWKLGVGGTVVFVPDAERYGHAPSLPPPPPRSLLGQSKVRIKPRLPLDISNHRYRDEHPNVWAPDPWEPSKTDRRAFEEKLMTLDFLASCSKSLTRLPPIERERDAGKHEVALGHLVQHDAHHSSIAWKNWLEKERRKKEKERRKAAAEAEAAAASTEASTAEPSSSLIGDSQFLQEPSASLEAGASMISAGSLGMPSEVGGSGGRSRP